MRKQSGKSLRKTLFDVLVEIVKHHSRPVKEGQRLWKYQAHWIASALFTYVNSQGRFGR
jgi:hypothetical protein